MGQDKYSIKKQKRFAEMTEGKEVLELGGGSGEFVSLCKNIAKNIISIDRDPKSKDVTKGDILKFLKINKKKFDMIYARHIIEHFEPRKVIYIFKKSYIHLKANGLFVLIFPNLKNVNVATFNFWNDWDHKRPYTASVLKEQLEKIGFEIIKSEPDNNSWDNFILKTTIRKLRALITGLPYEPPDYFIIAKKSI